MRSPRGAPEADGQSEPPSAAPKAGLLSPPEADGQSEPSGDPPGAGGQGGLPAGPDRMHKRCFAVRT